MNSDHEPKTMDHSDLVYWVYMLYCLHICPASWPSQAMGCLLVTYRCMSWRTKYESSVGRRICGHDSMRADSVVVIIPVVIRSWHGHYRVNPDQVTSILYVSIRVSPV